MRDDHDDAEAHQRQAARGELAQDAARLSPTTTNSSAPDRHGERRGSAPAKLRAAPDTRSRSTTTTTTITVTNADNCLGARTKTTWLSLNLFKSSNQGPRYVEHGVDKFASLNQLFSANYSTTTNNNHKQAPDSRSDPPTLYKSASNSSSSYKTATQARASSLQCQSSSNVNTATDYTTISSASLQSSSATYRTAQSRLDEWTPTLSANSPKHHSHSSNEMVSLSVEESRQAGRPLGMGPSSDHNNNNNSTSQTVTPAGEPADEMEDVVETFAASQDDDALLTCGGSFDAAANATKFRQISHLKCSNNNNDNSGTTIAMATKQQQPVVHDDNSSSGEPDEEQLRRILTCKRLSEGCNRFNPANYISRKNSLHMIGQELPPLTEGEPMRHMSYHLSQNIDSVASSSSSGSLRSGGKLTNVLGAFKRNSQDENTTSCSSTTSLDGPRSPTRRRSSTVSQCSSVLSEGARQQLNFDLSPDLPPDSSLLEANAISPTDLDRPASPEPSSLSGDGSFEMRPVSRMSQCDELMFTASPDSTLGDSNENTNQDNIIISAQLASITRSVSGFDETINDQTSNNSSENRRRQQVNDGSGSASILDNLERLISDVSTVKVSNSNSNNSNDDNDDDDATSGSNRKEITRISQTAAQKRAHTPFGADLQRNKLSTSKSTDREAA